MKKYQVNEIFHSIQGEGFWVGTPAVFIRFAGCNLSCPWCDTNHSNQEELIGPEILTQAVVSVGDPTNCWRVILTGGEPGLQVDRDLLQQLRLSFGQVAIETNGTQDINSLRYGDGALGWVTISPKPGVPVIPPHWPFDEVKVVLDGKIDPEEHRHLGREGYIQPCSQDYAPAVEYVLTHPGWKLSLQTQKILSIR